MTSERTVQPTVLVTGAAGQVFESVEPWLRDDCQYRLTDIVPSRSDIIKLDLRDYPAVRAAMEGIDIVLHLAIYTRTSVPGLSHFEINQRRLDVNVAGTQHTFEAARDAGVMRVVYMSSITVINGEPRLPRYDSDAPSRPSSVYGVTKLFGEQLGEMYARQSGMCVTCLRLGQPLPLNDLQFGTPRVNNSLHCGMYASYADIAGAINAAVGQKEPGWRKCNVVSHCDESIFDLEEGKAIGFTPRQRITANGFVDLSHADTRNER